MSGSLPLFAKHTSGRIVGGPTIVHARAGHLDERRGRELGSGLSGGTRTVVHVNLRQPSGNSRKIDSRTDHR